MKNIGMAEINLTEKEIEAAVRVLRSGALRQGKECDAFEQEFAARVGAKFAVTLKRELFRHQECYHLSHYGGPLTKTATPCSARISGLT